MKELLVFLLLVLHSHVLPAQCQVSVSSPQAATCGLCNGSVEVQFLGGTPPYAVNFNGQPYGSITGAPLVITNACAGPYMVSVTDGNNFLCTGMLNGIVGGSTAPPLSLQFVQNNPTCPGCSDGSVQAQVSGGTPPYTYNWNTGVSSSSLNGLQSGVYFLLVTDAEGCIVFDTIFLGSTLNNLAYMSGRVYLDTDSNSVYTAADTPLPYQQVVCQPSGIIAYTNWLGEYYFPDTPGNYSISYVTNPYYSVNNGTGVYNITLGNNSQTGFDFPLIVDSLLRNPRIYTYCPLPRCNSNSGFYISLLNAGNTTDSGEVRFHFDPAMTFVSSQPSATINGDTLIFGYASLLPGQALNFTANFILPGAGNILQVGCDAVSLDNTGVLLASDTIQQSVTVRCSFDPNDKSVSPEGDGVLHRVDMESELSYMIRFQNTGNDTAFNILVTDTLDIGLDAGSVQLVASSHDCWMQRINGNILRFYFTNIQLPDSNVNEPQSHGYVLFTCKGNAGNPDPTMVYNTANIYFDANAPVITNTTLSTFSNNISTGSVSPLAEGDLQLHVSPQPFYENCTVLIRGANNAGSWRYRILDLNGKSTFVEGQFYGAMLFLQRNGLEPGMYLLEVREQNRKFGAITKVLIE